VSRRYLGAADLILYCEDGDGGRGTADGAARDEFLAHCAAPVVRVRTKADLRSPAAGASDRPSVAVSVLTGEGLVELERRLAEVAFGGLVALGDVEPIVTRERHRLALERALQELDHFHAARGQGVDAAASATHLRAAVGVLDDLIGIVTPEDVLDRVFASFCVGK
jgi:tRNA modification GTPase